MNYTQYLQLYFLHASKTMYAISQNVKILLSSYSTKYYLSFCQ